ncbi:MAG: permease prefix domain 1-containing protein [Oscillospiraceae bacterium]|nr:permease prefix domain 1-containing protein [Oscillospiraceae bacterium]
MEVIRTYIENVFKAFEQNERVAVLKRDMLAGMEEKYLELKSEGKSENEAIGSVIANFGNMDEIAAELGVTLAASANESAKKEDCIPVSRDDAFAFFNQCKQSGLWFGIAEWLILTGVSAFMLISNSIVLSRIIFSIRGVDWYSGMTDAHNTAIALGLFAIFVAIAPAVVIYIVQGMKLSRYYEKYGNHALLLDTSTRAEFESKREQFMSRFTALIATGVALVLLAVGVFFLLFLGIGNVNAAVAALLFVIGFASLLFIVGGMEYHAFDYLLGRGDYKNKSIKQANQKAERVIGTVASVFWPLSTAAYLLWSFVGNAWGISWIIWPVAGVLFGAFSGGISTWSGMNEK